MINNSLRETGIGQYVEEVSKNIIRNNPQSVRLLTLTGYEVGPFWISSILRNLSFLRKEIFPHGTILYHFMNANLGLAVPTHRPCIVTLHDLITFIPEMTKQRLAYSRGSDFALLTAIRFSAEFIRLADRVICDSQSTLNDAVRYLKINRTRLRVIYLGVNHNIYKPRDKTASREYLGLPVNKKIILHVGVDEPRKNLATLFAAFSLHLRQFPESVLVRIGPASRTTKRNLKLLGIQDRVFHITKPGNFPLYYNAADVLAFPSTYEGFGLPPLEAMASGCPVVSSNTSSIPEVVGSAAVTLHPYDVEAFSSAIATLAYDSKIQAEYAEKGLSRSAMFSWERCASKTYSTYEEFL